MPQTGISTMKGKVDRKIIIFNVMWTQRVQITSTLSGVREPYTS